MKRIVDLNERNNVQDTDLVPMSRPGEANLGLRTAKTPVSAIVAHVVAQLPASPVAPVSTVAAVDVMLTNGVPMTITAVFGSNKPLTRDHVWLICDGDSTKLGVATPLDELTDGWDGYNGAYELSLSITPTVTGPSKLYVCTDLTDLAIDTDVEVSL